jgi:replicative DNA helicase
MTNRRPPKDDQAEHFVSPGLTEQALIGCVLIDPSVLDRVTPIVSAGDFSDSPLGELFAALALLHDARLPVHDITWLSGELARMDVPDDVRTPAALLKCVNAAVHAGHVVYYAEQVSRAAKLRRLTLLGGRIIERAADPGAEPAEIAALIDAEAGRLSHHQPLSVRTVGELAADVLEELDQPRAKSGGVMSGLPKLDEAIGPVMPGELVIVAARTGCGKTSLATQWAEHVAERGKPALIVSLEMRGTELAKRMLCSRAGLDSRDLRGGTLGPEERGGLVDAMQALGGLPVRIWSPPSASMAEIRAVARHAKATAGLGLLVVDYIGLVRPDDRRLPRYEQVSAISAGLKVLAKELETPLIALCQLNREADSAEPKLSHLRESGSIEQDADMVLLIHHPPAANGHASADIRGVSLIAAKHRHGETGRVSLLWHGRETRFSSPGSF